MCRVIFVSVVVAFAASCGGETQSINLDALRIGENVNLRYWMPRPQGSSSMFEMSEHRVYQELERVTGVHVEFEYPYSNTVDRQLTMLRESDDLPDIIEWNWLWNYPGGPDAAIDEELILPLRDLILQHAPNLFKQIADDEEVLGSITTETGRIYVFPYLRIEAETRVDGGLMIRQKWLDQTGFPMPATINDWRNLLLTMRDTDFGTTGHGQEYPFFFPVFRFSVSAEAPTYYFLEETNAFAGSWGTSHGMFRDGSGKVKYGPVQSEYRDMLVELNRWYEEELIHPNLASPGGGSSFLGTVSKCGATIGAYGFMDYLEPLNYLPAPTPVLDEGVTPIGSELQPVYGAARSAAIAASSENAVNAARFLDVAYSEWGYLLFNFGIEGASFEFDRGEPILSDDVVSGYRESVKRSAEFASDLMTHTRALIGGPYVASASVLRQIRDPEGFASETANPWSIGARPAADRFVAYDRGRYDEYQSIMEPITRHARANFSAFVVGQRPIAEFDVFVREIEALQLREALSLLYSAEADFFMKPVF